MGPLVPARGLHLLLRILARAIRSVTDVICVLSTLRLLTRFFGSLQRDATHERRTGVVLRGILVCLLPLVTRRWWPQSVGRLAG